MPLSDLTNPILELSAHGSKARARATDSSDKEDEEDEEDEEYKARASYEVRSSLGNLPCKPRVLGIRASAHLQIRESKERVRALTCISHTR
ncbi:hypothetical protein HBI70_161220 [Parastagonospora nodorum]|nr:hypothetical protein HBI70_161220 [Parastagonospora nodorum]